MGWLRFTLYMVTLSCVSLVPAIKFFKERAAQPDVEKRSKDLVEAIQERMSRPASALPDDQFSPKSLPDIPSWKLAFSRDPIGTPPSRTASAFYSRQALEGYERRRRQDFEWQEVLSPPLNFRGRDTGDNGVVLTWDHNPRNRPVLSATREDPLLSFEYRLYRWRPDSKPEELAILREDALSFTDRDLPARSLQYRYSVMAAVSGTLDSQTTVLDSQRSETVAITTRERFEIEVVKATAGGVILKVTCQGPGPRYSHDFFVKEGQEIGRATLTAQGTEFDFSTGLTLAEITENSEERRIEVDRPVFEPDGRRQVDPESGDPVFQKSPSHVRVRRVIVNCQAPDGSVRTFSGAPGPPEIIR